MPGDNILPSLYLKAEITNAQRVDDDVLIHLSDGRAFLVPLAFLGHFDSEYPLPIDAQHIILRRRPRIEHVYVIDLEGLFVGGPSTENAASIRRWVATRYNGNLEANSNGHAA